MPTPKSGYIYLIGSEKFSWYKIGMTISPEVRVRDIGVLLPFKMRVRAIWFAEDRLRAELAMHLKYTKRAINGEWFFFGEREIQSILIEDIPFVGYRLGELGELEKFSNLIDDASRKDFKDPEDGKKYVERFYKEVQKYLLDNGMDSSLDSMRLARKEVSRNQKLARKNARGIIRVTG